MKCLLLDIEFMIILVVSMNHLVLVCDGLSCIGLYEGLYFVMLIFKSTINAIFTIIMLSSIQENYY